MEHTEGEPVVEVDMLVRRPAREVWEAFADPEQIRRFWLARSTGRLETGATVTWSFKVEGARTDVTVVEAVPANGSSCAGTTVSRCGSRSMSAATPRW